MLAFCAYSSPFNICSLSSSTHRQYQVIVNINGKKIHMGKALLTRKRRAAANASVTTTLAVMFSVAAVLVVGTNAAELGGAAGQESETLSNIPQELSSVCAAGQDCKKARIQRPKSRKAESCTSKCVTTCIQGGYGSPGEGPFSVRRPLVVFKDGFRSRRYCKQVNHNINGLSERSKRR